MREEIKKYYEATKFNFNERQNTLPESKWPITWKKIFYKTYPRFSKIKLKVNFSCKENSLEDLLIRRKSTREFSESPLNFKELSHILFFSAGIKPNEQDLDFAKRMYPSAGARYPIEVYFIANNILEINKGLYHYSVKFNEIECLLEKNLISEMKEIINSDLYKAPLIMILTGVLSRSEVKYRANAYRFALLEAGHIGQNIYLLSEKLGLGCCAIGGFDNDKISSLLDLVEDEIPLYLFAIGKNKIK